MKLRKHITSILLSASAAVVLLASCLSDGNEAETVVTNMMNAIVTSFSMDTNGNVASNLSSYKFTIDNYGTSDAKIHALYPNDGIIFNPDSLPYGSIADSVKVSISFSSPDSVYFKLYTQDGVLGQYSDYSKDSALYFASYPDCRLTVVSRYGVSKTYHVKVNVHKVDGDSIKWNHYTDEIWSDMNVEAMRADSLGDDLFWFAESEGKDYVRSGKMSENARQWSAASPVNVAGGELLDLSTLYSWHGELLAVNQGKTQLLASSDGVNWSKASDALAFQSILGNQLKTQDVYQQWNNDTLSAVVKVDGVYHFAVSADARTWRLDCELPARFPVDGFSRPVSVPARSTQGNLTSRLYIVGGVDAEGNLTSSTWSCDGFSEDLGCRNWAEFPQTEIPAMRGATVLEYTLDQDHPRSFWLLQPGLMADGTVPVNRLFGKLYTTIYYSEDSGVSWHRLSRYYTSYADNSKLSPVAASSGFVNPSNYEIYFLGGQHNDGTFVTSVWGGALPKLTFKKER